MLASPRQHDARRVRERVEEARAHLAARAHGNLPLVQHTVEPLDKRRVEGVQLHPQLGRHAAAPLRARVLHLLSVRRLRIRLDARGGGGGVSRRQAGMEQHVSRNLGGFAHKARKGDDEELRRRKVLEPAHELRVVQPVVQVRRAARERRRHRRRPQIALRVEREALLRARELRSHKLRERHALKLPAVHLELPCGPRRARAHIHEAREQRRSAAPQRGRSEAAAFFSERRAHKSRTKIWRRARASSRRGAARAAWGRRRCPCSSARRATRGRPASRRSRAAGGCGRKRARSSRTTAGPSATWTGRRRSPSPCATRRLCA
mmetsp:Transcript_18936/g.51327  ORF Transcript_18936/g.51327 Transcript_18936/m.51327 type:complete len:320 (+) Transcript_18936:252-1211(+)